MKSHSKTGIRWSCVLCDNNHYGHHWTSVDVVTENVDLTGICDNVAHKRDPRYGNGLAVSEVVNNVELSLIEFLLDTVTKYITTPTAFSSTHRWVRECKTYTLLFKLYLGSGESDVKGSKGWFNLVSLIYISKLRCGKLFVWIVLPTTTNNDSNFFTFPLSADLRRHRKIPRRTRLRLSLFSRLMSVPVLFLSDVWRAIDHGTK